MVKGFFRIQRTIALVISFSSLTIALINFFSCLFSKGLKPALTSPTVYLVIMMMIAFLITAFYDKIGFRYFQIILLLIFSSITIIKAHESIYGIGFLLIATLISFKYGFFKQRAKLKGILLISYTFVNVEIAARLQGGNKWSVGIESIIYLSVFLFLSYLVYSDEIKNYIEVNKNSEEKYRNSERKIKEVMKQKNNLELELGKIDIELKKLQNDLHPLDLENEYNISVAEMRVLKTLMIYGGTDQYIADKLCLSYHTVKNHFRKIRIKLNAENREQIIYMCRNNFKEESELVPIP